MNTKLIRLLAAVCMSLCLIIAGEWLYASYKQHRLLTSIGSEKPQDYKTDELPQIELTSQAEESYVDLVTRPLFIKGRKPVDEPLPETAQAAAKVDSFDWQLTGVYSTKKTVSALFSRSKSKVAKDNYRKITVGDDLDGWKLAEINTDRALLKQGSSEKELLLRKPKLKALPRANTATPAIPSPFQVPAPVPAPAPIAAPEPAADAPEDTTDEDTTEGIPEDEQ
ncbi:MAG: hypothetical protein QX199_00860 [Methylococcaceae bacterium]